MCRIIKNYTHKIFNIILISEVPRNMGYYCTFDPVHLQKNSNFFLLYSTLIFCSLMIRKICYRGITRHHTPELYNLNN
jgi:hypothetical protein